MNWIAEPALITVMAKKKCTYYVRCIVRISSK